MHGRPMIAAAAAAFAAASAFAGAGAGALLSEGESALSRGHNEAALRAFEKAASLEHSAACELGLVRTYMQAGEYRRAMAFLAHTAAAHRDEPAGAALYAWLLYVGGQQEQALLQLAQAESRFASDDLLAHVRRELDSGRPLAGGRLLEPPARFAPYDAAGITRGARLAGSAWLFDAGRRAFVPDATLAGARNVWVRNGLGATSRATRERQVAGTKVAVLRLEKALAATAEILAPRDAFPGSIAYAVEYTDSRDETPRWPILRAGFIGQPFDGAGGSRLGVAMPPGTRGGPVFDAAGRVIGLALPGGGLLPASQLRASIAGATAAPGARVPSDQIYESAMRSTLQVIVAP